MKLIMNGDDFGITRGVNAAMIDCFSKGYLSSTSMMVNMPAAKEASELMKAYPKLSVGIHLNLTVGKPLTDCPSLVKADGTFNKNMLKDSSMVDVKEMECELRAQMERFIEFGEDKAIMVNNADWLMDLKYVELLREVGVYFSVNNMLRAECYKQRMEQGLSFFEFNYMIMQAYDFYHLHQTLGCNMQFGGNDQWSNMLAGTELIRKKTGDDAYAMTITLLLNSEGKKMGKTASGAVWLDPNKTSPYEFFQYWRNVDDQDVMKCMRLLTFRSLEEIEEMEHWDASRINEKKEILAYELTEMVHGKEEADKALDAVRALFGAGADSANIPAFEVPASMLAEDGSASVIDLLVAAGICPSKSEARRAIQQGGVTVGEEKVEDLAAALSHAQMEEGVLLRRGKKTFKRIILAK